MEKPTRKVIVPTVTIAPVCGLCGGCQRAVEMTVKAAEQEAVVLYHEIVHNPHVNQKLQAHGVTIVDDLNLVKTGQTVILRAHGEPPATYETLRKRQINYLDCTCPHVQRIHDLIQVAGENGKKVILIGDYGKATGQMHPEVAGSLGYASGEIALVQDVEEITERVGHWRNCEVLIIGQTTFDVKKFVKIVAAIQILAVAQHLTLEIVNTLCQATAQIRECALRLAKDCDLMMVVGGKNSHNTQELFECLQAVKPTVWLEDIQTWRAALDEIGFELTPQTRIGLTAGASTDRAELTTLRDLILQN